MKKHAALLALALLSAQVQAMEGGNRKRKVDEKVEEKQGPVKKKVRQEENTLHQLPREVIIHNVLFHLIDQAKDIKEAQKTLRAFAMNGGNDFVVHHSVKDHLQKRIMRDMQAYATQHSYKLQERETGLTCAIYRNDIEFLQLYLPLMRNFAIDVQLELKIALKNKFANKDGLLQKYDEQVSKMLAFLLDHDKVATQTMLNELLLTSLHLNSTKTPKTYEIVMNNVSPQAIASYLQKCYGIFF